MTKFDYLIETLKDVVYGPVKIIDNSKGIEVQPSSDIFKEYVLAAKRYFGSKFGIRELRNLTDFDGKNNSKKKELKINAALYLAEVDRINMKHLDKDPGLNFVSNRAMEKLEKAEMLERFRNQQAS